MNGKFVKFEFDTFLVPSPVWFHLVKALTPERAEETATKTDNDSLTYFLSQSLSATSDSIRKNYSLLMLLDIPLII